MEYNSSWPQFRTISQSQFQQSYKYITHIDRGVYGEVACYENLSNNTKVAIKKLRNVNSKTINDFHNETVFLEKVQDENVIGCLDSFKVSMEKGSQFEFFYVMPYCEKGNLDTCISEIVQLDELKKVKFCYQICRGVNALHKKDIIHRDLKPQNILVDSLQKIKLCDFGWSKESKSDLLQKTTNVGTPIYRSPDVLTGNYTKKCDIYSVGLIFYLIFKGKKFFNVSSLEELSERQKQYEINEKKVKRLQCHEIMKETIIKCMKQKQNQRFSSEQLLLQLQGLLQQMDPYFEKKIHETDKEGQEQNKSEVYERQSLTSGEIEEAKQIDKEMSSTAQITKSEAIKSKHETKLVRVFSLRQGESSISTKTDYHFINKLIKTRTFLSQNAIRYGNFQKVFTYFNRRKIYIQRIEQINQITSFTFIYRKLVFFIALFGYLRFIVVNKDFIENEKKINKIHHIENVKYCDLCISTKQKCKQFLDQQFNIIMPKLNNYLHEITNDISSYQKYFTDFIRSMVQQGKEKIFTTISDFRSEEITESFKKVIFNSQLGNKKEDSLKERIYEIRHAF